MDEIPYALVAVTVLQVPAGDAELAADALSQHGAFAVEERSLDGARCELRAVLGEQTTEALRSEIEQRWSAWRIDVERVDPTPLDTWKQYAAPVPIAADLVLRPAWLDPLRQPGVRELSIDPGAAFGLGDHPTTRLAAAAAWRLTRPGDRVLDVGCGTGALAIISVAAGAGSARAIDIADAAIIATRANAAANGVADRIDASTAPLDAIEGRFELVFANILAPTLIALAADLRRVTAGLLVVSGVLSDRYDHVVAALAPMQVVASDELDGWAAVTLSAAPTAR